MSEWTHNICAACWNKKNPSKPASKGDRCKPERCCYCGVKNSDGIYLREDPKSPALMCCGHLQPDSPLRFGIDATAAVLELYETSQETLVCLRHWKRELEGQLEYAYIVARLSEAIEKLERMELSR